MSVWSKIYERINWKDLPQRLTALAARNLNKMDLAIDTLDDRTIGLNTRLEAVEENPITVDTELKPDSENPVQNKVIYAAFEDLLPEETAQGNPISINDASGLDAKACSVDLLPIQDLSQGDPSPTNICPISGRTKVSVTRTGKNLFDPSVTRGPYLSKLKLALAQYKSSGKYGYGYCSNGIGNVTSAGNYTIGFLPCISGATYYIKAQDSAGTHFLDDEGNIVSFSGSWVLTYTHTATSSEKYIAVSFKNGTPISITLEPFTEYLPYQGETKEITLPQTVYGGNVDFVSGVLTVDKIYTQITRTGGSTQYDWNDKHGVVFNSVLDSNYARVDGICTHGTVSTVSTGTEPGQLWLGVGNKSVYWIGILDVLGLSISDFNTWIDNNSVYICYPLATPTEITLTAEQISLLKGNNTLITDGDNIILKYSADIKAWVENQLSV